MLTAINQTQSPFELSALADAYKAVADKLPPSDASEALKPVLRRSPHAVWILSQN